MEATQKRRLVFVIKLAVTVGILVLIYGKVVGRESADDLLARLAELSWAWLVPAALAQLAAIGAAIVRWDLMLKGQGIRAPLRHLVGSFMIGRFFGAVTPGGLGLQGYRLYDVATRTGKVARSTATVAIETLAGQMGFAVTVLLGSVFGFAHLGLRNVLLIDGFFLALIAVAVLLVARPVLFRAAARAVLGAVPTKLQTLVDAVCAYQGQSGRIGLAFVLSALVHVFNNFIYVFAARALGAELTVGQVFFVSSIQIFATIVPISINGVGVREAAALGIYTTFFGVPAVLAVLIPIVGFAVEMAISTVGGLVLLARKSSYAPRIEVADPEREEHTLAHLGDVEVALPEIKTALAVGMSGGALGGLFVGLAEGGAILGLSKAAPDFGVMWYGALAYSLLGALAGALGGAALGAIGRLIRRQRVDPGKALGRYAALFFAGLGLPIGLFRVRRDVFGDELALKSKEGLLVVLAALATAAIAGAVLALAVRGLSRLRAGAFLLRPWGGLAVGLGVALVFAGVALARPAGGMVASGRALGEAPANARNVLLIVVDTLRADAIRAYGTEGARTPNLDRFAEDAIRYDQHFANASWTRPSFASILTGRYPGNHGVMGLSSALPSEVTTLAEAFAESGYYTAGIITNPNITSVYNFQQGFDEYHYLEPNFVLGANDLQSKLLVVQLMRRVIQRFETVTPGSAYQDAETVNRSVIGWLDRAEETTGGHPFFLFVGYMDPHDPYFVHPYDGEGFDKASHQEPDASDAGRLRALYDGEVTYWDEQFGRLLDDLRRRGLYDETTIVVTADHGEEFGEHGGFWHGYTLYDEQVRVPLFVKLPNGASGGTVVRHWTQSVDLMPSLLEQNGLPAAEGTQGGLLTSGSSQVFAEESHHGNVLRSLRVREDGGELKLIEANPGNPRGLAESELYRVDRDPGEREDLAPDQAETVARVGEALEEAEAHYREGAARPSEDVEMSCEECQRLSQLGYVSSCESVCGS
jgi:arylsulfatase A-like enzyme/uncharacterized membrane protein YbhN (UPF0104 family)